MKDVRMYISNGCPHCEAAEKFLIGRGVTVEAIVIGFDPILQAGIRAVSGGQGLGVPIMISYATQETIVGNDAVQLERIAVAALSARARAFHAATA